MKKIKKSKKTNKKVFFRNSNEWKEFRTKMKEKNQNDFITGNKLSKGWNLHHCDFSEENYENITNEDNFLCLNKQSHEVLHFIYGNPKHKKDWKNILKKIELACIIMDGVNQKEEK